MARSLREATTRLNFKGDVLEVLETAAETLSDAADDAEAPDGGDADELQAILAEIGALYTMARERTIHAAYAEGGAERAAA
jgi:hypothetical protein